MSASSVELAARLGITYRQISSWVAKGWLRPDGDVTGTGNQHWFSGSQIAKAMLMADLVLAGVGAASAAAMASGDLTAISALDRALTACRVRAAPTASAVSGGT